MEVLAELKKRWFVTTLCILGAALFTSALVYSAATYVRVVDARENVVLANANESAQLLSNGSLVIGFTIELQNPSHFALSFSTISWSVRLDVSATGGASYLPIASEYKGPTEFLEAAPGQTVTFEYEKVVSDPGRLSDIQDFINFSASEGDVYTMETLPYIHDFRISAFLDDFEHDYQYSGELYLNDMVRIDRGYYDGEYT